MAAEPKAHGIARYGLDENPYEPRPLELLQSKKDARMLLEDLVEDIKVAREYVEAAAKVPEPAFVLVTGGKGAGCTTIANHLLTSYRDARKFAPKKFFVPALEYTGRDAKDLLEQWLNELYWALRPDNENGEHPGAPYTVKETDTNYDDVLQNATGLDKANTYEANARNALASIARILRAAHEVGFGVLLEKIEGKPIVNTAMNVFETTQTLVVLTPEEQTSNREEVEAAFRARVVKSKVRKEREYPVVSLSAVAGQQAKRLIDKRWEAATSSRDVPFSETGVVKAFDAKARSLGRVLELTAGVLRMKVALLNEGGIWPDDRTELEIADAAFAELLQIADENWLTKYG